jgi:hypothetical protein
LLLGEGAVAEFVARIDDLDADAAAVHAVDAAPVGEAGVPGAMLLGDHAQYPAVLLDQIMAGHAGFGVAEARDSGFAVLHARIVKDDHRDAGIARIEIGRGPVDDAVHGSLAREKALRVNPAQRGQGQALRARGKPASAACVPATL